VLRYIYDMLDERFVDKQSILRTYRHEYILHAYPPGVAYVDRGKKSKPKDAILPDES